MTRSRQRRQRAKPTAPPTGLVAAFTMVRQTDERAIAAVRHAQASYPHARRIIDSLHDVTGDKGSQYGDISDTLLQATDDLFSPLDEPSRNDPSMASQAGFYVGFAVCWLLLTAVNGQDGGR